MLPVVKDECRQHLIKLDDKVRITLKQIDEENPVLSNLASIYALSCPDEAKDYVICGMVLIYSLLRSQAEADDMEREIKV